jgi:septal ring factor EnvC (AmiA/AmiB activator)
MLAKLLLTSSMTLIFSWHSAAFASSLTAKVNVFESKLSQFERQMNEVNARQVNQVQLTETNQADIKTIKSRLTQLENQVIYGQDPSGLESYPSEVRTPTNQPYYSNRFTDRLYSFP